MRLESTRVNSACFFFYEGSGEGGMRVKHGILHVQWDFNNIDRTNQAVP